MNCPGASYQIGGDGLVRVNGDAPHFPLDGSVAADVRKTWSRWGSLVEGAARRYSLPREWVFGVLMQESRGNPAACSPCGGSCCSEHFGQKCCAFGLMQFTPATALRLGTTVEEMLWHPDVAVTKGAELLRRLLDSYGGDLIKALVSYNAGSLRCAEGKTFGYFTDGDYPLDVVKWSNTAVLMNLPSSSSAAALILSAGIVSAGLILGDVWKPRWA